MTEALAIVPVEKFVALVAPAELQELMDANLGGAEGADSMPLPRITLPTGGICKWVLASPMGDEMVDTLRIVVLMQQFSRARWLGGFGDERRPECSAADGKCGLGDPGGECATCPKRAWQNDIKPECKGSWRLWVSLEGDVLPMELRLGTTSQKPFREYAAGLISKRARLDRVITQVGLRPMRNPEGIDYAVATFEAVGMLPEEVWPGVQAMKDVVAPFRRTQSDLEAAVQTADGGVDV